MLVRFSPHRRSLVGLTIAWGVGLVLAGAGPAVRRSGAGEPAAAFLAALRERALFDTALDFLAQMETNPLAPVAFKQTLAYEKGLTMVAAAGAERDAKARDALFDGARDALTAFVTSDPNHRLVSAARNQLGNLLFLRGNLKVDVARKQDDAPNLLAEARGTYGEAHAVFLQVQQDLKAKLDVVNTRRYDPSQTEEEEAREQMRRDYLQAQLLAAQVLEDQAETFAKGTPDYDQALAAAETQYREIEKKYPKKAAGLYARMALGRCLQKRGKLDEAIGFFTELLDQPDSPELRSLRTDTLELAMACWLHPSKKLYAEAVSRGTAWQQTLRPHEARAPQALGILYQLALAHKEYAELLGQQKNANERQVQDLKRDARALAIEVARFPSDVQDPARQLIGEIRGVAAAALERPKPKSFADAKAAGKEAFEQMQNATFLIEALPQRIAQETDAKVKAELETQLEEAKRDTTGKRDEAIAVYRQGLAMVDKDTPIEELNLARMALAHLYYLKGDFHDAALLSSFVARRYPAQLAARESARIAMAAFVQLYAATPEAERESETRTLRDFCDYVVKQWPDQPVAADAWNALIPFVVRDGDFTRAEEAIASIPETAPQRGEIELKLGRAWWAAYRQGMAELRKWEKDGVPAGADMNRKQTELDQWKAKSLQILSAGLDRVRANAGKVDGSLALAAVSLAQIHIETQQAPLAVALLEDPRIGPLTLVRAKDPAVAAPGLAEETYRTSLRAYLASLSVSANADEATAKAKGLMNELKESMAGDPNANQRLVATYLGLARDLKSQMEMASSEQRKSMVRGFQVFLEEVSRESNEFQVLNWAGETFFGLAESFDEGSAVAPVTANGLYKQALAVYQRMIAESGRRSDFLPNAQYVAVIELRSAMIDRRIGDFNASINAFVKLLTEKNMMLNVQVEAARTFQQWAAMPGKEDMYQRAMLGYFPDKNAKTPTNIIWGWGKIGKMTAGRKEFDATFFEARYELARCRFEFANQSKDAETKKRYVDLARQDVFYTFKLYPELGGPDWKPKYDALLKRIQQARGEKADGLLEFQRQVRSSGAK